MNNKKNTLEGKLLTREEFAILINVSAQDLDKLISDGIVDVVHTPDGERLEKSSVHTYLVRQKQKRLESLAELSEIDQGLGLY